MYLYLAVLSAVAGFAIVGELEVPSSTGTDLSTVVGTHVVPLDDANTYFSNFLKSSSTMLACWEESKGVMRVGVSRLIEYAFFGVVLCGAKLWLLKSRYDRWCSCVQVRHLTYVCRRGILCDLAICNFIQKERSLLRLFSSSNEFFHVSRRYNLILLS